MTEIKRVRRDYTQDSLTNQYKIKISKEDARTRTLKAWKTKRINGTNIPWNKGKKDSQIAWNKGLTKNTDVRVRKYSISMRDTVRRQFREGKRKVNGCRHWKETSLEKILWLMLDSLSLSYEKNKEIRLKNFSTFPDAYVAKYKLCLYADGEYWHNYPDYSNKDKIINRMLPKYEYQILRFWGNELKNKKSECIEKIKEKI